MLAASRPSLAAIRSSFLATYDRVLAAGWPRPVTAVDVPTAYGQVRAYSTGREHGRPVVLLPGAGGSALMWHAYVRELGAHHPVLAVDPPGEPGASVQTAPISDARDCVAWFDETLAALDVTDAHVVGCSYGGWLALRHAVEHPARLATLTLLDPAGFANAGPRFFAWVIAGGLAGLTPPAVRRRLAAPLTNGTLRDNELMSLIPPSMGFRRTLPPATVLTDGELGALRTPSLFLLGARSALHDARAVAARLEQHVPSARVEIVPATGHALPTERPDLVTAAILDLTTRGRRA